MDTIEKELKQGADTTADLTKKKPQDEVLKVKFSTVSSDEGKLAAVILTLDCGRRESLERRGRSS
jgi:hypothetical protein